MHRRLTQGQARELIERAIAGEPRKALARDFKVSYTTMSRKEKQMAKKGPEPRVTFDETIDALIATGDFNHMTRDELSALVKEYLELDEKAKAGD